MFQAFTDNSWECSSRIRLNTRRANGPVERMSVDRVTKQIYEGRRISQMGHTTIAATFLTIVIYLLIQHQSQCYAHATSSNSESATSNGVSIGGSQRGARGRSLLLASRSSGPQQYMRAHLTPIESPADVMSDFLIDDEDVIDFNKRQSDDYGHMRFGKRGEQFDDYGHMRFGRSLD
uniref:(California timema) hypothetical protein n=1 Tax=Timema californicum TaxID=61474 RepID=A0A7R9IZ85_TIMCA|nr:unnamed protein product [Timema californicum]